MSPSAPRRFDPFPGFVLALLAGAILSLFLAPVAKAQAETACETLDSFICLSDLHALSAYVTAAVFGGLGALLGLLWLVTRARGKRLRGPVAAVLVLLPGIPAALLAVMGVVNPVSTCAQDVCASWIEPTVAAWSVVAVAGLLTAPLLLRGERTAQPA